jgi:hypothetical protein
MKLRLIDRLPPNKIWNEISKVFIISESIPNGINISIDKNLSFNSPFSPRNYL